MPYDAGRGIQRPWSVGAALLPMGWPVDQPARDVGVFVEVVTGADPVVAVGDHQWRAPGRLPSHQEHRRKLLALVDLCEVAGHMYVGGPEAPAKPAARNRSLALRVASGAFTGSLDQL